MKKTFLILSLFLYSIIAVGQDITTELTQLVKTELNKQNIRNPILHVYSPSRKIDYTSEIEVFKNQQTNTSFHSFYIASIGKTFTATAIGMLKEQGKLQFQDKISAYLPKEIMDKLHVLEGVEYSNEITIAQLLQHTSGLPDYFEDTTVDGSPNMINQLFIHPDRFWKPMELIQFSKEKMKPLFAPKKGYHYTDTEYVLLGLIIEHLSGMELHAFFKEYIFKPLQMNHTYMNLRSTPIKESPKMTNMYVGSYEVSSFKSLSADWAGGGIVSNAKELIQFQEALFTGKLIKKETLQTMQQWTPETLGMYYGFGLRKVVLNELDSDLPKLELIGHSGSTASFLYYCPSLDIYISGTLNQVEATRDSFILITKVLKLFV